MRSFFELARQLLSIYRKRDLDYYWCRFDTGIKKARSNDLANMLTLGVGANTVSVRLAGLENEYWPLNQTSTLSVLLVGFFYPRLTRILVNRFLPWT